MLGFNRRLVLQGAAAAIAFGLGLPAAQAQDDTIKIGHLATL